MSKGRKSRIRGEVETVIRRQEERGGETMRDKDNKSSAEVTVELGEYFHSEYVKRVK